MLIKLILFYVILLGESFKIFSFNYSVLFLFLMLLNRVLFFNFRLIISLSFLLLCVFFSLGKYDSYHISQDLFIVLIFITLFNYKVKFAFVERVLILGLYVLLLKTILLFFFPSDGNWGSGVWLDGNVYDFGIYKRIQLKGADSILMIFPLFFRLNKVNLNFFVFFLLVIFSGSRALILYSVLILIFHNVKSISGFFKISIVLLFLSFVLFIILNFQQRFFEDDGRAEEWRLLETAIVFSEVQNNLIFGNGLGSGFFMPTSNGSKLEDGINLYTHNFISWLLLKGGLFLVFLFTATLFINLKKIKLINFLELSALLGLNLINNYFATFTGMLLFTIYLNKIIYDGKN